MAKGKRDFMTVEQAAEYTKGKLTDRPQGFSADTIRRAARLGQIPGAVKFGKRSWLIPTGDIDAWMVSDNAHKYGPKGKKL